MTEKVKNELNSFEYLEFVALVNIFGFTILLAKDAKIKVRSSGLRG